MRTLILLRNVCLLALLLVAWSDGAAQTSAPPEQQKMCGTAERIEFSNGTVGTQCHFCISTDCFAALCREGGFMQGTCKS